MGIGKFKATCLWSETLLIVRHQVSIGTKFHHSIQKRFDTASESPIIFTPIQT